MSAVCLSVCIPLFVLPPQHSCSPEASPRGSEQVGWGAPPGTALPAVKEAGGGLHISSGWALSSDRLSECPDHQGSMAAESHIIKDQAVLKTRPCQVPPPASKAAEDLQTQLGDTWTPGVWKRRATWSACPPGWSPPPARLAVCAPLVGAPASPLLPQLPLACHTVLISYIIALFLPVTL